MKAAWLLIVLCVMAIGPLRAEQPRRIVSMNLCADQMVLQLAAPGTVASVSFLTADPEESPVAHLTDGLTLNAGQAEEIVALNPDLIVAGRYTTSAAKILLRRLGYRVVEVDVPLTFEAVRETYRFLGEVLERENAAEQLVRTLDKRFTALEQRVQGRTFGSVLILDANGFTVGRPSLVDQVLSRMGLINIAAELNIGDFGQVTMEAVLIARPDHLVRMAYRTDAPSLANLTLSHPALVQYFGQQKMISVPQAWLNCGGPFLADAAATVLDGIERPSDQHAEAMP